MILTRSWLTTFKDNHRLFKNGSRLDFLIGCQNLVACHFLMPLAWSDMPNYHFKTLCVVDLVMNINTNFHILLMRIFCRIKKSTRQRTVCSRNNFKLEMVFVSLSSFLDTIDHCEI